VIQLRPALFRGRHFEDVVIVLCVRWYLRYSLSYRDLAEMMASAVSPSTFMLSPKRDLVRRSCSSGSHYPATPPRRASSM